MVRLTILAKKNQYMLSNTAMIKMVATLGSNIWTRTGWFYKLLLIFLDFNMREERRQSPVFSPFLHIQTCDAKVCRRQVALPELGFGARLQISN